MVETRGDFVAGIRVVSVEICYRRRKWKSVEFRRFLRGRGSNGRCSHRVKASFVSYEGNGVGLCWTSFERRSGGFYSGGAELAITVVTRTPVFGG